MTTIKAVRILAYPDPKGWPKVARRDRHTRVSTSGAIQPMPPPNDEIRRVIKAMVDRHRGEPGWGPYRIQTALMYEGHDYPVEMIQGVIDGL